ncbi:1-(5-phosphoribosyl)-5-[(5-phosphoribosylamino)methylideneamino]imidazole-4-carboxamide isomerase [Terrilactibacillus laevilacticus]|uniref:1-(5-phosphoribosyl)-5-[(5-phosphoribosylamino)methylideneamino] imidazole-4-carboxamide isomerase n=1 Tax=Terrilactibacillus laevilacticus TaxID=1380157 RepID=A0ABW5PSY8_9BACI
MVFTILPAIDLKNGKCVRLFQGDFNQETVYSDSPVAMAKSFYKAGASWIHLVDLDGAKTGKPVNHDWIYAITKEVPLSVEVGGGIRDLQTVEAYLSHGVKQVILGSSAISDPNFVKEALKKYPENITIGIDAKQGRVAVEGWLEVSNIKAVDLAKELVKSGAKRIIYTDISRDGAMKGPNVDEIETLAKESGCQVVASGGVSSLQDVETLAAKSSQGISGAIIGKALYTNAIDLSEALKVVEHVAN